MHRRCVIAITRRYCVSAEDALTPRPLPVGQWRSIRIVPKLGRLWVRFCSPPKRSRRVAIAVRISPSFVDALNNLAVVLQLLGERGAAEACYTEVLRLAPDNSDIKLNFAALKGELGRSRDIRTRDFGLAAPFREDSQAEVGLGHGAVVKEDGGIVRSSDLSDTPPVILEPACHGDTKVSVIRPDR